MRRSLIVWCAVSLVVAGCATVPAPQLGESRATGVTGSTSEPVASGDVDPDKRLAISCVSLDAAPEVRLSSLPEVWAATNYLRFAGCTAEYIGPQPFVPTAEEAAIISVAQASGYLGQDLLRAYLEAVEVCTRVSDETGPHGFAARGLPVLKAAAALCPRGPQGKIIAAWATGSRIADGSYAVGATMAAGTFRTVMPRGADGIYGCSWRVVDATGAVTEERSEVFTSSPLEVTVTAGEAFVSDQCGIWQKID